MPIPFCNYIVAFIKMLFYIMIINYPIMFIEIIVLHLVDIALP